MSAAREDIYRQYADKVSAYVRGKIKNVHDAQAVVSSA